MRSPDQGPRKGDKVRASFCNGLFQHKFVKALDVSSGAALWSTAAVRSGYAPLPKSRGPYVDLAVCGVEAVGIYTALYHCGGDVYTVYSQVLYHGLGDYSGAHVAARRSLVGEGLAVKYLEVYFLAEVLGKFEGVYAEEGTGRTATDYCNLSPIAQ